MVRTATQDANEGTTQIASRAATRAKVSVTPAVSVDRSLFEDIQPIIQGTTQALETANNMYQTHAQAAAAMRQGSDEGVNEVDQANKRGEFMSFLFGQDAGYSTAVGIATKNFANNEYLRQMSTVEEHLDKSPEKYQELIGKDVETKIQEKYGEDPVAKSIAMDTWEQQSRKLAREHAAKHMVYAQEQLFAVGVDDLTSQFDDIHMNLSNGSTQAAQAEAVAQLKEILDPSYIYVAEDGSVAHPRAARNIQLAAVTKQLAAGNSTVLKAIPENFEEGLTMVQKQKFSTAKQQYDNAQAREGELIVETGLLSAAQGSVEGVTDALVQLDQQKPHLSGSAMSKEKWTEDKRRLTKILDDLRNKAARNAVDEDFAMQYYKAREAGDAPSAGMYYSKKAQKKADDMVVSVAAMHVARASGVSDPESEAEAIELVLNSPTGIRSVAMRAERYGSISEGLAEAVKQRVLNIIPDNDGFMSDEDQQELGNLRELYRTAPAQMRKALGADASAMIEITLNNSYESVKEIQTKRSNYIKNKELSVTKGELGIPSDMSVQDWIQTRTKDRLDPAALNYYQQQLQTGYKIYGGDTRAAEQYMLEQYNNNNTQWRGRAIKNAGIVQEHVDIPVVLDMLEGTGMAEALIGTRIPMIDDANPIRGFSDLNDVQFEVNPGTNELIIQSSQFSFPIVVQNTELQMIALKADEAKKVEKARREQAFKIRMGEIGKTSQMWPTPQE